MPDTLLPDELVKKAREVVDANRKAGRRITVAESCTGGLVSAAITEIPVQIANATGAYTRKAWAPTLSRQAAARSANNAPPTEGKTTPHA